MCRIAQRGCWAGLGIASQLPAVSSFHSSLVKSIRDRYLGAGRRAVTQRVPQHWRLKTVVHMSTTGTATASASAAGRIDSSC